MRYLSLFTGGFALSLLVSCYVLGAFPLGGLGALCLLLFLFLRRKRTKPLRILETVLLGAAMGFFFFWGFDKFYRQPLSACDRQQQELQITLTEIRQGKGFGSQAEGILHVNGLPYRVQVSLGKEHSFLPGDRIRGLFRISTIGEDGFYRGSAYKGEGFFLQVFEKNHSAELISRERNLWSAAGRLREYALGTITRCFPAKTAPFARALLLGDTSQLDFTARWDLRVSGIRHLVAVSGLHVSILCLLLSYATGQKPWLSAAAGIPVLILFSAAAGFSPSVVRASIMMTLLLLGRLFARRYDPLTELAAAALMMLILNPLTITSVSFQLSCCSVLGILMFYGRLRGRLLRCFPVCKDLRDRWIRWLCDSLSVSLSSLVFVTPLTMVYFGSVSLIAPLTNLLTVWLVPFLFLGILLLLLLNLFSATAAVGLGTLLSGIVSLILSLSHVLAGFPLAAIYTDGSIMGAAVVLIYGLGFYFLRGKNPEVRYFLGFSGTSLILLLLLSWCLPRIPAVTVTVLDVGQGQSILLKTRGSSYLVDCGGDRQDYVAELAAETLLSQGIFRLDGLILTHFDRDHVGAADEFLSVIPADKIFLPPREDLPPDERLVQVWSELPIHEKHMTLNLYGSESQASSNESGLCVLLDSEEYDILITGDRSEEGEKLLLSNHRIPQVDCLIAGHHGAETSTGLELLRAARPETVIISAGRQNPYGHPSAKTLLRLKKFGCEIRRTDLEGTITIRR